MRFLLKESKVVIMKRVHSSFGLLLSLMMVIGLLSGCGEDTTENGLTDLLEDTTENDLADSVEDAEDIIVQTEYERAMVYGLIPEEWSDVLDKAITYKEFCNLVTQLIQQTKPEKISAWEGIAVNAMVSDEIMGRDDGAVGLLYAAQVLDCCYINVGNYAEISQVEQNPDSWEFDETSPLWPELPEGYQMLQRVPGTPVGTEFYHDNWGGTTNTAFRFVLLRLSQVNEEPLLDYDENFNLRMGEELTRREAVTAVLRLGESESNLLKNNNYISVYDLTSYDKEIITDEELSSSSNLPEPTHENLTSEWKGMGVSKEKDTVYHYYKDFQETEIAFLAENGFNFCRVFFDFDSLRYPDFPEDVTLINEQELLELDQLIAWGVEYGVHIQLSASHTLGGGSSFDMDSEEWEIFGAYWKAIAHRYAEISSRYLSFDLVNEIQPGSENVSAATEYMRGIVENVRNIDPDRVLLISFPDNPIDEWVENMASIGLSLGCHPYRPIYISKGDEYYYAPGDVCWPYPYFPQRLLPEETLSISGDIAGKALRLDFWSYAPFKVTFGNGETITIDIQGDYIDENSCSPRFNEPYTIQIPEGVTKLVLQPIQDEVRFQEIGIESNIESHWLIPHDEMAANNTGGADLIWSNEKGWSSTENCTAEFVYSDRIEPMQNVAKKYNVGLMVNEVGSYAAGIGWDVSVKANYDGDMLAMLEGQGLSWCMCEMDYMSEPLWEEFDEWKNATVETYVHTSKDGHKHTIQYSSELLEVYRQYTSN